MHGGEVRNDGVLTEGLPFLRSLVAPATRAQAATPPIRPPADSPDEALIVNM